ncbi:hypothetical protein BC830DRAFT_1123607 [Chytriomyces sp. MP71]|nr:hypothetical protein BC830DRAFT_1123607 [Chytriomyces sp. MP71]
MLANLPTELAIDILVHVPVRDLGKCAQTCKGLHRLLDESNTLWREKCARLWHGKAFHTPWQLHWTTPIDCQDLTNLEREAIQLARSVHGCDEDVSQFMVDGETPTVEWDLFDFGGDDDDDDDEEEMTVSEGEEDRESRVERDMLSLGLFRARQPRHQHFDVLAIKLRSLIDERYQLNYCKWKWSFLGTLLDSKRIIMYPKELLNLEWRLDASWIDEVGRLCFHRKMDEGRETLLSHSTLSFGRTLQVRYDGKNGEKIKHGEYPSMTVYRDPKTWGWRMRNHWVLCTSMGGLTNANTGFAMKEPSCPCFLTDGVFVV